MDTNQNRNQFCLENKLIIMKKIFLLLFSLLLFFSCVKKTLYDPEPPVVNPPEPPEPPAPLPTGIILEIDWQNLTNVDSAFIQIDDQQNIKVLNGNPIDTIFIESGNHDIYFYNKPENISIDNNLVAQFINKNLNSGILYSTKKNISVPENTIVKTSIVPVQQIGQLTVNFIIELTDTNVRIPVHAQFIDFADSYDIKADIEKNPTIFSSPIIDSSCKINTFGVFENNPQIIVETQDQYGYPVGNLTKEIDSLLDNFNNNKTEFKKIELRFIEGIDF